MNDILVLYESKTGYSKQYAEWISEKLHTTCCCLKESTDKQFEEADLIIFGGGVNGSILNGLNRFERKMKKYPDKKVIYYATGIRPDTSHTRELIQKNNFGEKKVDWYYLRGGFDISRLAPGDKTLIRIYSAMIKRRNVRNKEDEEVISLLKQSVDFSSPDQVQPLIQTMERHSGAKNNEFTV